MEKSKEYQWTHFNGLHKIINWLNANNNVTPISINNDGNGNWWLTYSKETAHTQFTQQGEQSEIKRLKALIKEGFILLQQQWKKPLDEIDKDWENFKKQNNL